MVYHILKNGNRPKDITGHIVKVKDVESLYQLLHKFKNKKRR